MKIKPATLDRLFKQSQIALPDHCQYTINGFMHYSYLLIDGTVRFSATNTSGFPLKQLGYNRVDPISGLPSQKIHSENHLINRCWMNTRGAVVVNIRLSRRSELRLSYPCFPCFQLLKKSGISRCYFSTDYGFDFVRLNS